MTRSAENRPGAVREDRDADQAVEPGYRAHRVQEGTSNQAGLSSQAAGGTPAPAEEAGRRVRGAHTIGRAIRTPL